MTRTEALHNVAHLSTLDDRDVLDGFKEMTAHVSWANGHLGGHLKAGRSFPHTARWMESIRRRNESDIAIWETYRAEIWRRGLRESATLKYPMV